jgi:hypothetical protein
MNMSRHAIVFDTGPVERKQHNKVVIEQGANMRARLRILDATEIDRLLHQRKISLDQHTAGEHLFRDISDAGYFPSCKWALDSNIRGDVQSISTSRSDAMMKIVLARSWMIQQAGRRITEYLFGVILGERKVPDPQIPVVRLGLDRYHSFESWWYGAEKDNTIPELLAEIPIRKSRPS